MQQQVFSRNLVNTFIVLDRKSEYTGTHIVTETINKGLKQHTQSQPLTLIEMVPTKSGGSEPSEGRSCLGKAPQ